MKRIYEFLLKEHLNENRQMVLLTGPRQVGKTTTSRGIDSKHQYLHWDNPDDKKAIISGPSQVAVRYGLSDLQPETPVLVFDEIHKYIRWKSFLKGFFDIYGQQCRMIITGSARLNIYKRGGDSLMGRYFLYRMHPLSIREILSPEFNKTEIGRPSGMDRGSFAQLIEFGGFPEPFLKADRRFYNRWRKLRTDQLFQEDIRDLTRIAELTQVEMLASILREQAGMLVNFSSLANAIRVSVDTIRRWIAMLESMYYCFSIRPWFKNIPKSLRKQPKIFLWDWSLVQDKGGRHENLVASHLLKAVHFWTDSGFGQYDLYFLRDKTKREVDFLVTKENKPYFLVEVKSSSTGSLNPALQYFQGQTGAQHAFQTVFDMDFIERDCFLETKPVRVPALTFLSQLV